MTSTIIAMDQITGDTIGNVAFVVFLIVVAILVWSARVIRIREQEKTRREEINGPVTEYATNPKVYTPPDYDRTSKFDDHS